MDRQTWDENRWQQEFDQLMASARQHLDPRHKNGEALVVKTAKNNVSVLEIPDFLDAPRREALENEFIRELQRQDDTKVTVCLATLNGQHPEIPSWNFRSGLVATDPDNLNTEVFLWGGGDNYLLKPFRSLLPPEKK